MLRAAWACNHISSNVCQPKRESEQTHAGLALTNECRSPTSAAALLPHVWLWHFSETLPIAAHIHYTRVVFELFTHLSPYSLPFLLCELSVLSALVPHLAHYTADDVWHTMQLPMNLFYKLPFITTISIVWHPLPAPKSNHLLMQPMLIPNSTKWKLKRSGAVIEFSPDFYYHLFRHVSSYCLQLLRVRCAGVWVSKIVFATELVVRSQWAGVYKKTGFHQYFTSHDDAQYIDRYTPLGARSLWIVHTATASSTTEQIE